MNKKDNRLRALSPSRKGEYGFLYARPMRADRTGSLFTAFPYPTKISPEAIALFIAAHTKPGDTILDVFAGSGTTGIGALLCENPTAALRARAKELGLKVEWGPRNAVLYELSTLGAFIGQTLTNPPEPRAFAKAASQILAAAETELAWMYEALGPDGRPGRIRHLVWSEQLRCPSCHHVTSLWKGAVTFSPASISNEFICGHCGRRNSVADVRRVSSKHFDEVLGASVTQRQRQPAYVYGRSGKNTWSRPVTAADLELLKRIDSEVIPDTVPVAEVPWGDLYRAGYHEGMSHLHHFYTRRNLIVFAKLWQQANNYRGVLRDALRFWLLSYNASHSTIMTRVVAKAGQDDLVVTSTQPGVLYVSGLPVEKDILAGIRRKLKTISSAFETIHGRAGRVEVRNASSLKLDRADESIDYVFTDPPFGGNIPYAEVNFINEAWLGRLTETKEEVVVSRSQGKTVGHYEDLLTGVFKEVHRVLKPASKATVVFHSATAEVWNALQAAYEGAGYGVVDANVLDKTQASFKQVQTAGAVSGDPLLLLEKQAIPSRTQTICVWDLARDLHEAASKSADPAERTPQRLYSRLITHFLSHNQQVPLDADEFYEWVAAQDKGTGRTRVYA